MKRGREFLFFLLFFQVFVWADTLPPVIVHTPVTSTNAGGPLALYAIVVDNQEVAQVIFFFRQPGEVSFHSIIPQQRARTYEVILTGQDVVPPYLEYYWQAQDKANNIAYFPKIAPTANPVRVAVKELPKKEKEKTLPQEVIEAGSIQATVESAAATFPANPQVLPLALIQRRPGKHVQYNMNYFLTRGTNSKSYYLFRKEEDYTDRKFDEFRFEEKDLTYEHTYGDFYYTVSELSLNNVKLRGAAFKKITPAGSFSVFGGRSQIPRKEGSQTSAVFRQILFGIEKQGAFTKKGSWTFHLSKSFDQKDSIPTPTARTIRPTDNTLASLTIQKEWSHFSFLSEIGLNEFDKDTEDAKPPRSDYAAKGTFTYATKFLTLEAMGRRIGTNYVTAGTLENFVDNDRLGYKFSGDFKPLRSITLSLARESYEDNLDGSGASTTATEDQSAAFTFELPSFPMLSFSIRRLIQDNLQNNTSDTLLRNKNITFRHTIPSFSFLGTTLLSYTWQDLDYLTSSLLFNILYQNAGLDTAYKDVVAFSTNYQFTRTREEEATRLAFTRKKTFSFGLQWNIIPFEFNILFNTKISRSRRTDGTTNLQEREYSLAYVYYFSKKTSLVLESKIVNYDDWADRDNAYENHLLTLKWIRTFP